MINNLFAIIWSCSIFFLFSTPYFIALHSAFCFHDFLSAFLFFSISFLADVDARCTLTAALWVTVYAHTPTHLTYIKKCTWNHIVPPWVSFSNADGEGGDNKRAAEADGGGAKSSIIYGWNPIRGSSLDRVEYTDKYTDPLFGAD